MYRSYNKCYKSNNCCHNNNKNNKHCKKIEVCWDQEDNCGCRKETKCCQQDNKFDNCKGCVCDQLKKLDPATVLDVYLSSGVSFINVNFLRLDPQNCCAYFLDPTTNTPIIIACNKIDAIRKP